MTIPPSQSIDSDCDSDVSSVAQLKNWLDDFGKQQKGHFHKTCDVGKAPNGTRLQQPKRAVTRKNAKAGASVSGVTSVVVVEGPTTVGHHGPSMTPVRFKAAKSNVAATDTTIASVKQLSNWLANDPTSTKTTRACVRKGINVIRKSRAFDKGMEDVIVEEAGIEADNVSDKKDWLRSAFDSQQQDQQKVADRKKWLSEVFDGTSDASTAAPTEKASSSDVDSSIDVSEKKKWLSQAFDAGSRVSATSTTVSSTAATESTMDKPHYANEEADSSIDVSDKKKWLQNVFKNGAADLAQNAPSRSSSSAAGPAKKKWRENSKRRLSVEPTATPPPATTTTMQHQKQQRHAPTWTGPADTRGSRLSMGRRSVGAREGPPMKVRAPAGADGSPRRQIVLANEEATKTAASTKATTEQPKEEEAQTQPETATGSSAAVATTADDSTVSDTQNDAAEPSDFRAAREKLLQRSAANGIKLKVRTKVDMRKAKFERWEKDLAKGAGPNGMLKKSWEQGAVEGRPSISYSETYKEDRAPRKSLLELP